MKRAASVVELKARLSEYLRLVKAGHEVVVTERGVPVARVVPLDAAERDKALSIVRSGPGIELALETARRFVDEATAACDRLGRGDVVDALRAAPLSLIATVS